MHRFASKKLNIILLLIYKLFLDLLYVFWVAPYYSYRGLTCNLHPWKIFIMVCGFIILLLPIAIHSFSPHKNSDIINIFLHLCYFIPGWTFLTFCDIDYLFIAYYCLFYIAIQVALQLVPSFIGTNLLLSSRAKIFIFLVLIVFLLSYTVLSLIQYNGFRIKLDLNDVYSIRSAAANAKVSTLFAYIKNPLATFVPILICGCLLEKKYMVAGILTIVQLALFAFGASKMQLFSLALAIVFSFLPKKKTVCYVLLSFCGLLVLGMLLSSAYNNLDNVTDMFVRRMMFLPNKLSYDYYLFFSNSEFLYLRDSVARYFGFHSPYAMEASYIIGQFNGTGSNCNNGLMGDAFGNFGWFSIIVYPFLYYIFGCIFNFTTKQTRIEIVYFISLLFAILLYDSSYFTVYLTHGFLFISLMLLFHPFDGGIPATTEHTTTIRIKI